MFSRRDTYLLNFAYMWSLTSVKRKLKETGDHSRFSIACARHFPQRSNLIPWNSVKIKWSIELAAPLPSQNILLKSNFRKYLQCESHNASIVQSKTE